MGAYCKDSSSLKMNKYTYMYMYTHIHIWPLKYAPVGLFVFKQRWHILAKCPYVEAETCPFITNAHKYSLNQCMHGGEG